MKPTTAYKGQRSAALRSDGAMALHQLLSSRRRLRLALAATTLLSISLTLPVLLIFDVSAGMNRSLRAMNDGFDSVKSGISSIRAPSIGSLIPGGFGNKPAGHRILVGDEEFDSEFKSMDDNAKFVPAPPPLPGTKGAEPVPEPLAPYTLVNVLETMTHFHDTFAVMVYDPPSDKFVAHYSNDMRWISSCHKLLTSLKIAANSLRTLFPDRFNPDQPEFAMAISSADFPGIGWNSCLRQGRTDCYVNDEGEQLAFAPVLHFGSVFRSPIFPSLIAMPMPQLNQLSCYHFWTLHKQICNYYLPRSPTNPHGLVFGETIGLRWNDLTPQVVWRGTDFSYLHKMEPHLRTPNFEMDVASQIDLSGRVNKKTAATQAMRAVYDELIPRWKGVVWTAEAHREAEERDRVALNRNRRMNQRAQAAIRRNKKRAKKPENRRGEKIREQERRGQEAQATNDNTPWANIKFASAMYAGRKTPTAEIEAYREFDKIGIPAVGEGMSLEDLGRFKYHIDLGGGGGTTWSGTLEKLGLPGLLFHHVTPTKDYLHEKIVPWVHYVPVREDLSDLKEKYEWAESHPRMARKISDNATELARSLGTMPGMEGMFRQFYEGKLRQVVEAYAPVESGPGTWREVVSQMVGNELLRPIMECGGYYHHDCRGLVDDIAFSRVHDRDVDMSARKG